MLSLHFDYFVFVCDIVQNISFLLETNDIALEMFERDLIEYHIIRQGGSAGSGYFTAILLRQTKIYLDDNKTHSFENTRMGRGLQIVKAHIGGKYIHV